MVTLSDEARQLLDCAPFAHLATLQPDGSPKVEPVWVGRDGDRLLVATDRNSLKARNMDADSRVALSITAFENPYVQLLVRGRVAEVQDDSDLTALDRLSAEYLGKPFPRRKWSARVIYVIEPTVARFYASPLADPRVAGNSEESSP